MLIKHNLSNDIIKTILDKYLISHSTINDEVIVNIFLKEKAQRCLDDYYILNKDVVPSLLPVQFYYLLSKCGLYDALKNLLELLKTVDINRYAMYSGYLYGARFYEYEKALSMYNDLKSKIIEFDSNLNFSEEQLKEMWMEAYTI